MTSLRDGKYVATCKEHGFLAAASNGHSLVWPHADVEVQGGIARFSKAGVVVWSCNAAYAALHFRMERV
jgi:hypothetical protein